MTTQMNAASSTAPDSVAGDSTDRKPIIVDLGKKDRKDIRKLKAGKPGKLMRRLEKTIAYLHENGALAASAQPVIIVVRQRPKRKSRKLSKLLGLE